MAGTAVAAALLLAPAGAQATTWCVDAPPGCSGEPISTAADLQAALQGGERSDGTPDTAVLAAGTYTDPDSWTVSGSDALTLQGAGAGADGTVLTTSSSANVFVLDLAPAQGAVVTARDLRVLIPESLPDGLGAGVQMWGDTFERVDVISANPGSSGIPSMVGGGTFRDGTIGATGEGLVDQGIQGNAADDGNILVERASITAVQPIVGTVGVTPITVESSFLHSQGQAAVASRGATTTVRNTVIESNGYYPLSATTNGSATSSLFADHVTVVRQDELDYAPVEAVVAPGATGNAIVVVTNSIMRGFSFGYLCQAPAAGPDGAALLDIRYSNFTPGSAAPEGDCTASTGTGNIDAGAQFAGPADYHLTAGSTSIDAGDPAGGLTTDRDGNPRPTDGDGDGTARRDMGAYEFQSPPPSGGPPSDGGGTGTGGGAPTPISDAPAAGGGAVTVAGPVLGFGARTLVSLGRVSLTRTGVLRVPVVNRNGFAVVGRLNVRTVQPVVVVGRRRVLTLGSAALRLPAGARRTARVVLSRRARAMLRRRALRVRLVATLRDPQGRGRTVGTIRRLPRLPRR